MAACGASSDPSGKAFPALKNDLLIRAARGEEVERVPVWLHRQAGRYLPEFRDERTRADFFTLCRTPELACRVTIQPLDRFPLDAAIIFSDILVVPQALGLEVLMVPGSGPQLPQPLVDPTHLPRVRAAADVDVQAELGYVFDAISLTRHRLEGRAPVIGFAGAPWTLMAYMVEGKGAKSWNKARAWLYRYPAESRALLQTIVDVVVPYLVGQVRAGAQVLEVFDSWAGDLTPELFREFVLPGLADIASRTKRALRDAGLEPVPMTIFPRGAHFAFEWLAKETEYDVISLDWGIEAPEARRLAGDGVSLQGNLDPAVLYADGETIDREAARMVAAFGRQRYICNLGHGMLPDHEPRAVAQLVESIKKHSSAAAAAAKI